MSKPLNLRIKDVNLNATQLIIRAAKGGKDRVVPITSSALENLRQQIESARAGWRRDQRDRVLVALPHHLAGKYRRNLTGIDPRTVKLAPLEVARG